MVRRTVEGRDMRKRAGQDFYVAAFALSCAAATRKMDAGRVGRTEQRPSLRRPAVMRAAFLQDNLSRLQVGRDLRGRDEDFGKHIECRDARTQHARGRVSDEATRAADIGEWALTHEG